MAFITESNPTAQDDYTKSPEVYGVGGVIGTVPTKSGAKGIFDGHLYAGTYATSKSPVMVRTIN